MQFIVGRSLRFRWIVVFVAIGIMALGFAEIPKTKVDVFPEFAPPQGEIQTIALGNSSNEVEELITVPLEEQLSGIELYLTRHAKVDDPIGYQLLQTVPGIGKVLGLVLLYEIHDIRRFESVGRFVSYCRLVKCAHESAGKKSSTKGNKIGNAHLKWAFSEAACLMLRELPEAESLVARKEKKFDIPCRSSRGVEENVWSHERSDGRNQDL